MGVTKKKKKSCLLCLGSLTLSAGLLERGRNCGPKACRYFEQVCGTISTFLKASSYNRASNKVYFYAMCPQLYTTFGCGEGGSPGVCVPSNRISTDALASPGLGRVVLRQQVSEAALLAPLLQHLLAVLVSNLTNIQEPTKL